ncbi:MAG: sialate O-acetylesterase [Bdellovibrionales bacterium]|nr:sialate O-acetylesterase [Bdellovibrionales bacterium]
MGRKLVGRKQTIYSVLGVVAVFAFLMAFQNCGVGFEPLLENESLGLLEQEDPMDDEDGDVSPDPVAPTPTPIPTPAPVVLIDSVSAAPLPIGFFVGIQTGRVFQRDAGNVASVPIELSPTVVQPMQGYRRFYLLNSAGVTLSASNIETAPFSSRLTWRVASAGMSYRRLRVSYYGANGVEQQRWMSPEFTVGEVFIAAGQSNSATHGESPQISAFSMNRMVNPVNLQWARLVDPMPIATNGNLIDGTNPGGSPWPAFADAMSSALGVPVGVVSVGYGGTSLAQWQKGAPAVENTSLYPRLILAANALNGCSFRAVLWHQGETDALDMTSTATYVARMNALTQSFKSDTGCMQKWVIAQAAWLPVPTFNLGGYPNFNATHIANVAAAQRSLWTNSNYAEGPNTDAWTAYPADRYDQIHFSNAGLTRHGQAWAGKVRAAFGL